MAFEGVLASSIVILLHEWVLVPIHTVERAGSLMSDGIPRNAPSGFRPPSNEMPEQHHIYSEKVYYSNKKHAGDLLHTRTQSAQKAAASSCMKE